MGNEIKENIITRVKKELGISDAVDDLALYEFLCKTLIENHPDKYSDREAQKIAEERFKVLSPLRDEFFSYLEMQRASNQLVKTNDSGEASKYESIIKSTSQEIEILKLKDKIKWLEVELKEKSISLEKVRKQYDDLIAQSAGIAKENLTDIYKPKKFGNFIGLSATLLTISTFNDKCQSLIASLGVTGKIGNLILIIITVVWLMRLGRNIIMKSFANSIIDKTLMDPDLKVKLHIIKTRGSYPYYYFTESDVVSLVDKQLQKGYLPILFWGAYNTIRRSLVEYLILELEHKHFIERTSNNDLQKIFYIHHERNISDSDYTFDV